MTDWGLSEKKIVLRQLGSTGIRVTPLCYGCAGAYARDLISDETAVELFRRAYEGGIRFFDTAHSYGKAEERIGRALRELAIPRKEIVLSTKFGTRVADGKYVHDVSDDWVKQSLELSLKRMGTDSIDVFYLHGAQIDDLSDRLLRLLEDFKRQKLIRAFGANTFDSGVITFLTEHRLLDVVMLDYNVLKRYREPQIQALSGAGVGVVAGQAMAEGVFLNTLFKIRRPKDLWYLARTLGRKDSRELFKAGIPYRFLNGLREPTASQIALKYVLDNPYVASASVGTCHFEHLRENLEAQFIQIPKDVAERLNRIQAVQ